MPLSQTDDEINILFTFGAPPNTDNVFEIQRFMGSYTRTLKSKPPAISNIKPKTDIKSMVN